MSTTPYSTGQRLRDLLAMGRVANLPSVVSNVLVGCLLGFVLDASGELHTIKLFLPCLVGSFLYLGGCFLNDWKDAAWDASHKSNRPIPAGRWSPILILILASSFFIGSLAFSLMLGSGATVIAILVIIAISIYTWLHKRTTWAILPMGLCRALLYPLGLLAQFDVGDLSTVLLNTDPSHSHDTYYLIIAGFSFSSNFLTTTALTVVPPMVGLLLYIAGLSLLARFEAQGTLPQTNKTLALCLLLSPLLTHGFLTLFLDPNPWLALLGLPLVGCVILATQRIKKSISAGVSLLLAGIPLIDFITFFTISYGESEEVLSMHLIWLFPVAAIGAFFLSLLLQRFAPAT